MIASFSITTAHAGTRIVTQGRAGYSIVPERESRAMVQNNRRETRVALVMEKPRRPVTVLIAGRAGNIYIRTPDRAR